MAKVGTLELEENNTHDSNEYLELIKYSDSSYGAILPLYE